MCKTDDDNSTAASSGVLKIKSGCLHDKHAIQLTEIQGRQFLATGVVPTVGQRVEPFLDTVQGHFVHLSGQVVNVAPAPTELIPMAHPTDKEGSGILSAFLWEWLVLLMGSNQALEEFFGSCTDQESSVTVVPLGEDGVSGGLVCMNSEAWEHFKQQGLRQNDAQDAPVLTDQMDRNDIAEMICNEAKEYYQRYVGALHGQRVTCEGRLHFDHDIRRGSDEGPWADDIPLDGRDTFSWELVRDDNIASQGSGGIWRVVIVPEDNEHGSSGTVEITSFLRNLGPNRHPRCWPWSMDTELPFERSGEDYGEPIDWMTLCLGPFGCNGEEHDHGFAEAA